MRKDFSNHDAIHQDHIGEYKSEYVTVRFDKDSAVPPPRTQDASDLQEIKRVDLNELGYWEHTIGLGQ